MNVGNSAFKKQKKHSRMNEEHGLPGRESLVDFHGNGVFVIEDKFCSSNFHHSVERMCRSGVANQSLENNGI